jgi:hypothetical protein
MDGLKGIAQVVEYILYEVLALLMPGATFIVGVAYASAPAYAVDILRAGEERRWLALVAAYVVGLGVQGISRPVTALFGLPGRLLALVARIVPPAGRQRVRSFLFQRHSHPAAEAGVDLVEVAGARWRTRLGLAPDADLTPRQVQDLSFSAIVAERHRLDRFRAVASASRGIATAVAVCSVILVWRVIAGDLPLWRTGAWLICLAFLFAALMERADMYDNLWKSVWQTQFLAVDTAPRDEPGADAEPPAAGSVAVPRKR